MRVQKGEKGKEKRKRHTVKERTRESGRARVNSMIEGQCLRAGLETTGNGKKIKSKGSKGLRESQRKGQQT